LGASCGEFLCDFDRTIKHGNRKTLRFHVQDEIFAHDPQTDQANITLIRVHFGISFCGCSIAEDHFTEQFNLMANVLCEILVTETPLTTAEVDFAEAGAIVDFLGVVRPIEDGRQIEGIEYEAHREMAEHQLKRIAGQAAEEFGLKLVIVHHRIGFIAVGEPSLFLRVASLHRTESFRASQWIVDELKKKVPIWKKPRFQALEQRLASRTAVTV
jgi:molybdopterin synthase catalytic subunit